VLTSVLGAAASSDALEPGQDRLKVDTQRHRERRYLCDECRRQRSDATTTNLATDVDPTWSPDGGTIAYSAALGVNFEIVLIRAVGGR
jgi:hypothetical protein